MTPEPTQPKPPRAALVVLCVLALHSNSAFADGPPSPQLRTATTQGTLHITASSALTTLDLLDLLNAQPTSFTFQPPIARAQRATIQDAPVHIALDTTPPAYIHAGPWRPPSDSDPLPPSWAHTVFGPSGETLHTNLVFHAHGDLLITAPNNPVTIVLQDLTDGDDTQTLTAAQSIATTQDFTLFLIRDIDDDALSIQSTTPIHIQNIHNIQDPGFVLSPSSLLTHQAPSPLFTSTSLASAKHLFAFSPSNATATLHITDHSDTDDTQTATLLPSTVFTTMPLDETVIWREDLTVFTSLTPLDNDIITLQSSAPIFAITGPFEPSSGRASSARSAPIQQGQHAALLFAPTGTLTLFSPRATPTTLSPLVSRPPRSSALGLPSTAWSLQSPLYSTTQTVSTPTLFYITSQAPFTAFSTPSNPDLCCGPQPPLSLAVAPTLPPVAFAGPPQTACPGQDILFTSSSFDPDNIGSEPSLTAFFWDLDIRQDSDGDGSPNNDIDSEQPVQLHTITTPGRTEVQLTVLDNDGQTDTHITPITIRLPSDPLCGEDPDNDGFGSFQDNCPAIPNPNQSDIDNDNQGDLCDQDIDDDSIPNALDNCPFDANPLQTDIDSDGQGNTCDLDIDGDGFLNTIDNCPNTPNPLQSDLDSDTLGDLCDPDIDNDSVPNNNDNCPNTPNPSQSDIDADRIGDLCDPDIDDDSIPNALDNCPFDANPEQIDSDSNGVGNVCEADNDSDGIADDTDNCPNTPNTNQSDLDADQIGDLCDPDIDGDSILNANDNCPNTPNANQLDSNQDGQGDICQEDADNDGIPDDIDNCPNIPNTNQENVDQDLLGDLCDPDIDGDNLDNAQEQTLNTNPRRTDSDGDLLRDDLELQFGTNPLNPDTDGDGLFDGEERAYRTNPLSTDSDGDDLSDAAEPDWNIDSDNDGLINALDPDSDNGGMSDGDELRQYTNPLDPTDDFGPTPTPPNATQCAVWVAGSPSRVPWSVWWGGVALFFVWVWRRF